MRSLLATAAALLLAFLTPADAQPLPPAAASVPEPLRPWIPWVLGDVGPEACPFRHGDAGLRQCAWPGPLKLDLTAEGARFEQTWWVDQATAVGLPGEPRQWPVNLTVGGKPWPVVAREERPVVALPPGEHRLAGDIRWAALPDVLRVPPETGILHVTVAGKEVPFPHRDAEGRLWLQQAGGAAEAMDRLEVQVHRRADDDIPFLLETRIELQVAGRNREVLLGPALPAGFVAQQFAHSLPARLEPDGRLRVQIRAGGFSLILVGRSDAPVTTITAPTPTDVWTEEEIWVLQAHPDLRQVQIEGVPGVDPTQTRLPDEWRALPAWLVKPGAAVVFKEQRRGDPAPPPDRLTLSRDLWLDFAGTGLTVRDTITGALANAWRLEMPAPMQLGHVSVGGKDQLITRRSEDAPAGVELREGRLNLLADSRLEGSTRGVGTLPAVGWDQDFERVQARLHLPPGWRLFDAGGIDDVSGTWLRTWSLLDLFLLLLAVLATGSLFGWRWGLLALAALGLAFPEPDAPQILWLAVLAGEALRRVLPEGKALFLARVYRLFVAFLLVVWTLPFIIHEVRVAMYPVLEHPWNSLGTGGPPAGDFGGLVEPANAPASPAAIELQSEDAAIDRREMKVQVQAQSKEGYFRTRKSLQQVDPNAAVQTGPGLPGWSWNAVALDWSGPVQRTQEMKLVLLSPGMNLVLGWLRAILVGVLLACVLGLLRRKPVTAPPVPAAALALLVSALGVVAPESASAQATPPPEMLQALKDRLLQPPPCTPTCADLATLRLQARPGRLTLTLEVGALAATAIPLPGAGQWVPDRLSLDDDPAPAWRDEAGTLWLRLGPGRHRAVLEGPLPPRDTLDLPLPMRPRFAEVETEGYSVAGLEPGGVAAETLQLVRTNREAAPGEIADGAPLPPFARVERTLSLALDWTVETRVVRTSPPGASLVLAVPLLPGESVTTEGVRVTDGRVVVNMGPQATELVWHSMLVPAPALTLQAPSEVPFTELWRLEVSSIWHVEQAGIPVVRRQDESGGRMPEWRPWPGETVTLTATRPAAVVGQTVTIDDAKLHVRPGLRATDATLTLGLRSSRGGPHVVTLPGEAGALLVQEVKLGGAVIPVAPDQPRIELPLTPGAQSAEIRWQTATAIGRTYTSPVVDLGIPAVNLSVDIEVPAERWILLAGGPRSGPAVLFWSMLAVLIGAAYALGRSRLTPLRWWHWLLLGLGLSQTFLPLALVLVGWFFALGLRGRHPPSHRWAFNLGQLALVGWTLVSAGVLIWSVRHGLLGLPDMQIEGNGSYGSHLRWFTDRSDGKVPESWVLSVPLMAYRVLMLAWALWLARSLLRWIRWAWTCFTAGGHWRPPPPKAPKPEAPKPEAPKAEAPTP